MDIKAKVNRLVRFYKTRDPFEMVKGMNVILINYYRYKKSKFFN